MTRSTRTSPATVHRNEIGRAIALAGHHDNAAGLQGNVCNQRVSDNDGGDAAGKFDELGLIDIDRDGVGRSDSAKHRMPATTEFRSRATGFRNSRASAYARN